MGAAKLRVVVLDDYQGYADAFDWSRSVEVELVALREHLSLEALVPVLADADVVVAMRERTALSAEFLKQFVNLKLVITTGMRNDSISVPAGVTYCGTDILPHPVVELTWALILGLARKLPEEQANLRAMKWQQSVGLALNGLTLGLMGLGKAGSAVAKIGQSFGMRVIAHSQNLDPSYASGQGVEAVSKAELLAQSDVLSLHLRLSDRTRGIMGADEFAAMRESALFINTSRAGLVDTDALVAALHAGQIAGAGLDVFDIEPIASDDPLLSAPNCLLTPHIGFVVEQNYELFFKDAIENIAAFAAGTPIRTLQ
jgi:phosphoglycerate dehydrogenase-like enzyme